MAALITAAVQGLSGMEGDQAHNRMSSLLAAARTAAPSFFSSAAPRSGQAAAPALPRSSASITSSSEVGQLKGCLAALLRAARAASLLSS
jgi:hypothetical protein